jgi:hypothetical protein
MIDMTWTATPALYARALAVRPVGAVALPAAAPAPIDGTRVPSTRFRPLAFGAGAAIDEGHAFEQSTENHPTLGIHSPGRSLS